MKKLYPAVVLLLVTSILTNQYTLAQSKPGCKQFLSNNPADADAAYQKSSNFPFQFAPAQGASHQPHGEHYLENKIAALKGGGNGQQSLVPTTGQDYDVKYYRLELRVNPDTSIGKYIRGKVTTYFVVTGSPFTVLKFDMATALSCDSVYYHGAKLAASKITRPTDVLSITLPALSIGTLDSVTTYYKGVPPTTPGFSNGTGFVKSTHNTASPQNYIYTLSEPYSSYTWWPCKSFIVNDKADSMDLYVSTPTGFKTAGNGKLMYETTIGSNVYTYWKERYSMPAYLVAIAVANYIQYPTVADTVTIGGTKMPVFNYLFPETNTAAAHTSLNRVNLMLTTFSSLFGDYPFKNEKYGNYTFGFGGGMEHTTFSGESSSGVYNQSQMWDILAHELGHQWWGDNVTCASWQDIWLNESFADYSEGLCIEFAPSIGAAAGNTALSWRTMKKNNTMSTSYQAKAIYAPDTSSITTIFSPAVYIYDRGGMVISMLRTLLGDANFFQALKNYQYDPLLRNGNGFTADIKRHMEAVSGLDLSTFFNQWIYNTGFAQYNAAKWNNIGNKLYLSLPQTTSLSALSHFDMPVVVRIRGAVPATMDTTVVIYDDNRILNYVNNGVLINSGASIVQYNLSFVPTTITFDPYAQTIANGSFAKDPSLILLASNDLNFIGRKENNNAFLAWNMTSTYEYSTFELQKSADARAFKSIETYASYANQGKYNFDYIDYNLPVGTSYYRVKITAKNGAVTYTKVIALANAKAETNFIITPNPATEFINIKWTGAADVMVNAKVLDASGKVLKTASRQSVSVGSTWEIPVRNLPAGNYFVEIEGGDKQKIIKKVVLVK